LEEMIRFEICPDKNSKDLNIRHSRVIGA
jgi:hypothetical protein